MESTQLSPRKVSKRDCLITPSKARHPYGLLDQTGFPVDEEFKLHQKYTLSPSNLE